MAKTLADLLSGLSVDAVSFQFTDEVMKKALEAEAKAIEEKSISACQSLVGFVLSSKQQCVATFALCVSRSVP